MLYNLHFFSSKCRLFHNTTLFGFCITHILNTECAKIWKKIRRQKVNVKGSVIQIYRNENCQSTVCQVSTSLHNSIHARLNRLPLLLSCAHQDVKILSYLSNLKLHTHNHSRLPALPLHSHTHSVHILTLNLVKADINIFPPTTRFSTVSLTNFCPIYLLYASEHWIKHEMSCQKYHGRLTI